MNRQRIAAVSEKVIEYGFYGLIFFLPISKALVESFVGLVIFAFIIKKIASRDFSRIKADAEIFWLLLALLVFNALSLINSGPFLAKGLKALLTKWTEYFLIFMIAIDHFKDAKLIKRFLYVFVCGAMFVGISALTQRFLGFEFFRHRSLAGQAVTGPFENPNSLSSYLVLCLPLVIALACLHWRKKVIAMLIALACLTLLGALLLTFSRSGWLGFLLGMVATILVFRKKKLSLFILASFILALFLMLPFGQRISQSFTVGGDSQRFVLWRGAIEMILEHPFLGKGLGTFMDYSSLYVPGLGGYYAHNSFLQMWAESGVFTLIAFLSLVIFVLYSGVLVYFKNRLDSSSIFLGGLIGGLFGFLVASFFDVQLYSVQLSVLFWVMLGVTAALESILLRKGDSRV